MSARLALAAHPMAAPGEPRAVRPGQSLGQLMEAAVTDPVLRAHYEVTLDGVPVPQDLWAETMLADGQLVNAFLVPAGGNDTRKFIRTVLQFAVMAAAVWIGGGAGGAITSKWLASAAAATVSIAGNLAINALVPLPQPGFGDAGERFSPAYYPETARNEAAFYQPVRVVFGEHRFFPALQGLPIQESVGEDVYLRYLLSLGPMPLKVDPASIRIGETSLSEFEGVDYELRLKPDDPPLTLYTGDTFQLSVGALLEGPGVWTTRTTQPDVTEIAVVLGFRAGLGAKDDRNRNQPASVSLEMQYRPAGSSDAWQDVRVSATGANGAVAELGTDRLNYGNIFANLEAFAFEAVAQQNAQTGPVSLTRREPGKPFRHVVRAFLPKGQYDVRVRRANPATDDERIIDDVHWEFLDSVRPVDPNPLENHAVMALRIKGSNQLSGAIDTINMVVTRMAPSLDPDLVSGEDPDYSAITPEDWEAVAETRNNADACLFVLQGPMVARKVADTGIHWPSLAAFWKWCDVNGFAFDFILDRPMRRDDMLQMICAAARARPVRIEGQYHFVIDAERSGGPVQVFTGLNVRNFRVARSWPQPVHALRIPFLNRENDYRQDERILYLPGYSADGAGGTIAASLFERLELVGITDPEIIARLGYFHAATALSQTERYSFEVPDAEGLTARQGDLIGLQHDVLVTGLAAARVRARMLNGSGDVVSVDIDTSVTLDEGVDYGLVRRRIAGAASNPGKVTAEPALPLAAITSETAGETSVLVLAAPVDPSIAPDIGEMVVIGETGKEYLEGLVKATRGLDNWGAGIEAVAYAPNRFGAGEGVIPPFDPKVTVPVDRRPSAPTLAGIEITDDGIAIAFSVASGRTRDLARFDVSWRLHAEPGGEGGFEALPPLPGTARVAVIPPGEPGERYDASIVAVDQAGRQSDPLLVLDISASDALAPVTGATAEGVLSGADGGPRLPRLRAACDPVLRDDVDVIHIEARPAGGLDADWRVRDWLAPAEPGKDIANVDPGELIDVSFRARTRRGVYAPRVIVASVQIPEELISSDTQAVAGRAAAEVLEEIDQTIQDVADLIETYGSTESAAASAAAAAAAQAAADLAKTASEAAQAISEAAAANADEARALAETASSTATTQAGIATTAATTAGGHASAASSSASSAASSATSAGNSAAAANTSNLAAQATARDLLPGTFENGLPNPYFTQTAIGAPSALADLAASANLIAVTDASLGAAIEVGPNTVAVHPKGVITVTPGAVYEVTTVWRASVNRTTAGNVRMRSRFCAMDANYASLQNATVGQQFSTVADGVRVFTYRYAARLENGDAPTGVAYDILLPTGTRYLRVGISPHNGAVEDGKLVVGALRVVDVTARQQAAQSAASAEIARADAVTAKNTAESAAATATTQAGLASNSATNASNSATAAASSATLASTKATEAEQSATAADADRIAAQTARSGAEAAQAASVTAKNTAESAAATATTQAGLASNSATNAGNSATAAAGSASTASTQASNAASSATAAQADRVAAQTARSGAEAAQTASVSAKESAESAASAAATSQSLAANSATQAGNSASAAATSASSAASSATSAGNSATAANSSNLAATVTAAQLLPSDFREQGKYWTGDAGGSPETVGPTGSGVSYVADLARIDTSGSSIRRVATKGVARMTPGRVYRIRVRARLIDGSGFPASVASAGFRILDRDYVITDVSTTIMKFTGSGYSEFEHVYTATGSGFLRGQVQTLTGYTAASLLDLSDFVVEDITESTAAAGSAAAASVSATQAVGAKNDAEGAASAAGTSASVAANAATQAGNSASASATSASSASASATSAGEFASQARIASIAQAANIVRVDAAQGNGFFTNLQNGNPETISDQSVYTIVNTGSEGPRFSVVPDGGNKLLLPKAVFRHLPNQQYRFRIRWRHLGASAVTDLLTMRIENIDANYSRISSTSTQNVSSTAGTGWQETLYTYTAPASPVSPFLRPHVFVRAAAGALPDAVEIAWIEFEQVGAQVATLATAFLDTDGSMAAYTKLVTAGSGFAGVAIEAKQSDGAYSSTIRYAAQTFAWGVDFNTPRFAIDAVQSEVYALNAAGTVKTWQVNYGGSGRVRLRNNAGVLTYDSDNGGVLGDTIAPNTVNRNAAAVTDPGASATNIAAGNSLSAASATLNKLVASSPIELMANIRLVGIGGSATFTLTLRRLVSGTPTHTAVIGQFTVGAGEVRAISWTEVLEGIGTGAAAYDIFVTSVSGTTGVFRRNVIAREFVNVSL